MLTPLVVFYKVAADVGADGPSNDAQDISQSVPADDYVQVFTDAEWYSPHTTRHFIAP